MRYTSLGLFIVALLLMQVLIGGAGLAYSLPATILLGLAGVGLAFVRRENPRGFQPLWTGLSALLLAGYIIVRTQFSPVAYLARWDLFLALGAVVTYFATTCYFTRARDRMLIVGALLALGLVHIGTAAIQFKQGDNYMLIPGIIRSDWEWRASGLYIYPNHLAGLLEMLGLMALSICCWGRVKNWVRILAGYCALMSLAGIALTGSRGGYLSAVVGLVVFCGCSLWVIRQLRPERFWPMLAAALVGLVLLVGGAMFVMAKSDLIAKRLATVNDPTNMRISMWKASLRQYHLSPVTGTGSGTYLYYGREFRAPTVQEDPMFVHNDYLHLLAEYGVIGAVLGGLFLLPHLFAGLGGMKKIVNRKLQPEWRITSNELALAVGALSGVMALLFHSLLDFNFHLPSNLLIGAFLFAILALPSADLNPLSAERQAGAGWMVWVAPGVAVAMLVLAFRLAPGEYFGEMARRALRDRRYEEARLLAQQALIYERKNPNIYFTLGEARHYLTLGTEDPVGIAALHEQAAEAYEDGLKLFPRDTRLLLKLGQTLDLAGRFDQADAIYQRAIAGDPNFGNVYAYYGLHFRLQNRLRKAEFYFLKAQQLGEEEISPRALQEIARFRQSEVGQRLLADSPEEQTAPATPPPVPAP